MKEIKLEGYYLPGIDSNKIGRFRTEIFEDKDTKLSLRIPILNKELIETVMANLRNERNQYLVKQPVRRIIDVFDAASRLWLNPNYHYRKLALRTIPLVSGFSKEVVEASIVAENRSSLKKDIISALKSEIGNPLYLDGFQYSRFLKGYSMAFGPELIVAIFTGNIPALPHLSLLRSALVKSACLGKVASGEPIFAVLYAKSIEELNPNLAKSMAILNWRSGEEEVERVVFSCADAIIVYGGIQTCKSIREKVPPDIKLIEHGHKLGFGVIAKTKLTRNNLKRLASAVAYDVSMFDQQACLAPQVYFVEEDGKITPVEFAKALAKALQKMVTRLPVGKITLKRAGEINQIRAKYEFKQWEQEDVHIISSKDGISWTVIYERSEEFKPFCLNRVIRINPIKDIFDVIKILKPFSKYLQNAAVAIGDSREKEFLNLLGQLGISRITSPGRMPLPSMMWHHDGIPCLASLLRWTDIEKMGKK